MSFSNYLENKLLDHAFGSTAYTAPSTRYVALFTTDPTDGSGGTEVTGGSYARKPVTFSAASSGAITNSASIEFPTATATWGTVIAIGIYDALTGTTNFLAHAQLTTDKTISSGDVFRIPSGDLDITLN